MKGLLTTLNSKYIHSNLAVRYLYQAALPWREQLELREFTINNEADSVFIELIRGQYDLICFSCYIWNIERILYLAENLKKACPGLTILLGGPEVSFEVEHLMTENPAIDFVLAGEGEETYPHFLQAFYDQTGNYEEVGGLSYRRDGQIFVKESSKTVDFSSVPFVYEGLGYEADKVIYYESTRGCPYRCAYCLSCLEKKMRPLPMDRVRADLAYFLREKVKQVKLIDRTFNYDEQRTMEIVNFLIREDNGVTNFHVELCGDLITNRFIDLMASARPGLFQFEIGVQSTNPEVLAACNRISGSDLMGNQIRKLRHLHNVHLHLDLIAGLPFEDYHSFGRSFDHVYAMEPHELQLGFLKMLKGTPLREKTEEYGMIYRGKAPYEVIATKWMSPEDLVRLKQIETVLDLYGNRGGFQQTISFVLRELFSSPFRFFENLAGFYYEQGFQDRSHKKEDLYRIFDVFAKEKAQERIKASARERVNANAQTEQIRELLFADMKETLNFDAVKKFEKKGWELTL